MLLTFDKISTQIEHGLSYICRALSGQIRVQITHHNMKASPIDSIKEWNPFLILWFPHSGCRWLNRSLLAAHPQIATSEYFAPWLTHSTDMVLMQDRTSQVHKARSLPELAHEFHIVKESVDYGRQQGVAAYLNGKLDLMQEKFPGQHYGGALSPGAPEPLIPDLPLLFSVLPKARIIHLVRHPYQCFLSFKTRAEMDSDPFRIASSWVALNASIRTNCPEDQYFLQVYEELKEAPENKLIELLNWLNIDFNDEMLKAVSNYHGRNQNTSMKRYENDRDYRIVMEIAGEEAAKYGYHV